MFIVQRRDAVTLMPLIKQHINPLSEIHSDEWRAYGRIKKEGYTHFEGYTQCSLIQILIKINLS